MTKKKKKKVPAKKPAIKTKPLKSSKLTSEEKKRLAANVATGIGAGIGALIWHWVKKVLLAMVTVLIVIVLAKLIWSRVTGNPYPWGFLG